MWSKFVEAVHSHFEFLQTEFGFAEKTTKPPIVIYESDKVRLIILFDESRGRELDLVMRRLSDNPRKPLSLGIDMLIRLKDGQRAPGHSSQFPKTEDALEIEVKRLAELLRKYGSAILSGDLRDFERLERMEHAVSRMD